MAESADPRVPALEPDDGTARVRDIDHRVKNNLQLVCSLLLLQGRRAEDAAVRKALDRALARVSAVAAVNRHVVRTQTGELVELAELARDMVREHAGSAGRDDIEIQLDLDPVFAPARQGAPFALTLGELLANALEHAFRDRRRGGTVRVSLRRDADGLDLTVRDDGVGAPRAAELPEGFGLTVARSCSEQLGGELLLESAQPGLRAVVRLPVNIAATPPAD